jgi:hypothetical protein
MENLQHEESKDIPSLHIVTGKDKVKYGAHFLNIQKTTSVRAAKHWLKKGRHIVLLSDVVSSTRSFGFPIVMHVHHSVHLEEEDGTGPA